MKVFFMCSFSLLKAWLEKRGFSEPNRDAPG
jgi:hypothetical protein